MSDPSKFRNLAIIAHVDHGKTTLVDQLLQAGGAYRANQAVQERAMDSMDLEREKGITIKAKNTSILWNGYTINIVDTPGHADFGGEVERVMKMVDGVLLVVDAFEGPQAQTRFVLRKALQEGLMPIVVINKIDRPHADPAAVHDQVLELFLELGATDEQFEAPFVYGSARDGYFMNSMEGEPPVDCTPLLFKIVEHIPAPKDADPEGEFKMLVSNIDWDDYVGRVAIGRITSGTVKKGDTVWLHQSDGSCISGKATRMYLRRRDRYSTVLNITDIFSLLQRKRFSFNNQRDISFFYSQVLLILLLLPITISVSITFTIAIMLPILTIAIVVTIFSLLQVYAINDSTKIRQLLFMIQFIDQCVFCLMRIVRATYVC